MKAHAAAIVALGLFVPALAFAQPEPEAAQPDAAPVPPAEPPPATPPPQPVAPAAASARATAEPAAPAQATYVAPAAGFNKSFYIRDETDSFRLYPGARFNLDFNDWAGEKVTDQPASDGGPALKARLFVRRFRLELGGDFWRRVQFFGTVEFGGQPLTNANGKSETAAGGAGQDPTAASARFQPVEATTTSASIFDLWLNFKVDRRLNLMVGQTYAPIGIEHRTSDNFTPLMERNIAIRSFAEPNNREIGMTAWGDFGEDRVFVYEAGVFAGDGQNRPQVDNRADLMGRVFTRPFADTPGSPVRKFQVGVSGRWGVRDAQQVGYDYAAITTGQGFVLWNPTYKDRDSRVVHVIPSGTQTLVGGEIRLPVSIMAVQAEAYVVNNHTREAIDGFQLTNTERLGGMKGVGWYIQLEAWPFGEPFISGDPGFVRPVNPDLTTPPPKPKQALELVAVVSGIDAHYDGASRGGAYDSKTPGAPGGPGTKIEVLQFSGGVTYWYTKYFRAMANYNVYRTPGSSDDNLALVPGNLGKSPDKGAHTLHEIGTRLALQF